MALTSVTTVLTTVAAESGEHSDPAVPVWVVGLIAFGILLALLVGVVAFGGGREHS
ncbi:hypothetical protein [Nocardioides litoris]|uniref:hypothetical protein n=1 Tax=Nocardioides litoris TaxID=1926648 RepID=UPI0014772792|nr:hypothetical protein [Nocardioides litoris]